jgi:hypothetical protein
MCFANIRGRVQSPSPYTVGMRGRTRRGGSSFQHDSGAETSGLSARGIQLPVGGGVYIAAFKSILDLT